MSTPARRSRRAGGEFGEDQVRTGLEAEVRGAGSDHLQRVEVAPAALRKGYIEGDCFDREHVSPTSADFGEDPAASDRLSVSRRLPAVVWETGAGAIESVRPGGVAEPL